MSESTEWQSSPVIKNVVVQDGGELLVIGTLYGGLTMSLTHGDNQFSQFTRVALVELSSMLFVDVMRLFCVAGSDAARRVNVDRYAEFMNVADQHKAEFSLQITRMATVRDSAISIEASQIEKKLVWSLERLRSNPGLDRSWDEMSRTLAKFAGEISEFCERAAPEFYSRCRADACSIVGGWQITNHDYMRPDDFVRARFGAQSSLLVRLKETVGLDLGTIKDDIDRVLAVPYFTIDNALLATLVSKLASPR